MNTSQLIQPQPTFTNSSCQYIKPEIAANGDVEPLRFTDTIEQPERQVRMQCKFRVFRFKPREIANKTIYDIDVIREKTIITPPGKTDEVNSFSVNLSVQYFSSQQV